jgi:hypothetical protein
MKNTNKSGGHEFEKSWHQAFEGASIEPSERLWVGIEAAIANEDATRYRRGIVYYKWLVAAGLLLFASVLGYMAFQEQQPAATGVADGSKNHNPELTDATNPVQSFEDASSAKEKNISASSTTKDSKPSSTNSDKLTASPDAVIQSSSESTAFGTAKLVKQDDAAHLQQALSTAPSKRGLDHSLSTLKSKNITDQNTLLALTAPDRIYGVLLHPVTKQDRSHETFWAGLNMTPGYFNPNYQVQTEALALQSPDFSQSSVVPMEEHNTGFSMSFGMEVGMRLSNKWQLSGGLQYLNNNVQSTTNTILDQRTPYFSSVAESVDLANSRGNITFNETALDNTFQFISVPVQAGFTLVDKRLQVLINAGIASDIFLKNRVAATDNSLESVTIRAGSEAPFRTVYFNGLLGAQASYEFLPRYMITLEPRYKVAISDFARPEANYNSLPSSFGVGVGVKYIFK